MIKNYVLLMVFSGLGFLGVRYAFEKVIQQYFGLRLYLVLAVTLLGGFLLHNSLLLMLLASVALLVTASSRIDAMCRLPILVGLTPNVDQYITIAGLNITSVGMPVMLSLATGIVCMMRPGSSVYRKFTIDDGLVVTLIIIFSLFYNRPDSFSGTERVIFTMGLALGLTYYLFRRFVLDQTEFGYVIAALAGTAMILSFIAICEARLHWPLYDSIYMNQASWGRMSLSIKVRGGMLRAPASFSDSTAFAVLEMVGVFAVIASRRFFRSRLLWSASIALGVVGLLAAQSRGSDLGLLFGLFVMMIIRRRYGLAVAFAGGGTLIVAFLLVLAPSSPKIAAYIGAEPHVGTDQDYRQTLLRRGLEVGMEHPLLGNNMQIVLNEMSNIKQGEGIVDLVNSYLTIFLSSGIFGLTVVVVLLIGVFGKMFRLTGGVDDQEFKQLQMFAAGGFGGILLTIGFTPMIYERNEYWLMLLLACARNLSNQTRSSPQPSASGSASAATSAPSLVHRWQPAVFDPG